METLLEEEVDQKFDALGLGFMRKKIKEGESNCCTYVEVVVEWSQRWVLLDQKRN